MGIFDRFPYSSTHEMNLDFMLGKATEIAEDMQTVATGMAQVQSGLSAISEKTEQATQAAAAAAQSASSIEGSVTAAEEAAEEAQMHNESAQTWANNAMTYKADCQRSATEAAASSSSAAQAATAAAASEDTVATYAQAANASAQSAANNNDSAHQYANQASASASNATFHSSNAQTAATNAQTAATNANTSATNASASADRAASLKTDVETLHRMCVAAVDQAATDAVNAANSAAQAAATKTDVENLVESLPEDFTDLNNTVNQLSDEIAQKADLDDFALAGITIKNDVTFSVLGSGTPAITKNGDDYIISGISAVTEPVLAYADASGFNSFRIQPNQHNVSGVIAPATITMMIPFYMDSTYVYCFRFTNDNAVAIQRITLSGFSGVAIQSFSVVHGFTNGAVITVSHSENNVSLSVNGKKIVSYNTTLIQSVSGVYVCGYFCSAYGRALSNAGLATFTNFTLYNDAFELSTANANAGQALQEARKANANINRGFHFSFDDVIDVFQDLTTNAGTYTSIFDNAFLADLKTLHDAYGACISLYCFYALQDESFTLADATNAFANEFTANSDWLRFGFHSYMQGVSYESGATRETQIKADYDLVITELVRITGSINCIDRMPRLQNYAGSLTACKAIRDTACGVVGLLASSAYSDSQERDSYYFDTAQNDYMAKHYKYYDADNMLMFLKTSYGLNSESKAKTYINDVSKANMRDFVEMFLHETQWTSGMSTMFRTLAKTFTDAGYQSSFYMDRLI